MARPVKDGVDYWPRDVYLREDKKVKLIKGEFGIKGVYIYEEVLDAVYRENGYYKKWDDDDCLLMSAGVGDGCTPNLIAEVIRGCLNRSLFDEGVFKAFGVLTSKGIQRRFIQIVYKNRAEIPIAKEYWLLSEREVPASAFNKLAFFSVYSTENPVKSTENPVKSTGNTQSKVKESKVYRESNAPDGARPPTLKEVQDFVKEKKLNISAEKFFYYYSAKKWKGFSDWKAKALEWNSTERKETGDCSAAYDLELFEKMLNSKD